MSSTEKHDRDSRPTPWYSNPAAKATFSIWGVGVSFAALLLFAGLWILRDSNSKPEGDASNMSGEGQGIDQKKPESGAVSPNNTETDNLGSSAKSSERDASATVGRTPMNSGQDVRISAETDLSELIRGRTIQLHERVDSPDPVYIVAQNVALSEDAIIRAPKIWIFAESVNGGTLDVSGTDGMKARLDGSDAGSIYIVSQRVKDVNIKAIGGNGARGKKGSRGSNGADGDCAGFGGWEPARRGGNGRPGGTGGRGGNGGSVRIVYGPDFDKLSALRLGNV